MDGGHAEMPFRENPTGLTSRITDWLVGALQSGAVRMSRGPKRVAGQLGHATGCDVPETSGAQRELGATSFIKSGVGGGARHDPTS